MNQHLPQQIFEDVTCTACGCLCDDIRVTVQENSIVAAQRVCAMGEAWFLSQQKSQPPVAEIQGTAVSLQQATERAATLLAEARYPLIFGLSRSSTPGQRAAVRLADQIGGVIDTTASLCHSPSIMAIQEVGESTCTLGEVRQRADLVIFWGCDPLVSHPRHLERYSGDPPGVFVPGGRDDRTIVVIDNQPNSTGEIADHFFQLEPESDFELIWTLRSLLRDDHSLPVGVSPEDLARWNQLLELMKGCRYGVVFFGLGLARTGAGHRSVEALLRLVDDLNQQTRFAARRMRIPGDVTGADSVLCWQTGFPFSVNLTRGYPRFNPGEYTADDLLARGEADACLLLGSEGVAKMSAAAQAHLREIPVVAIDHPTVEPPLPAEVQIRTGLYGLHFPGTAYRMDEVPLPLRPLLTTDYPSDHEVLQQIMAKLPHSPSEPIAEKQ